MAKIISGIGAGLQGTLDGLSFYRMKGVDKTIVRKKGGHTKAKVKKMPKVQAAISEFSGRSRASKFLRSALSAQVWFAGRNLAGAINALMLPVQEMDKESEWGQRHIALSTCPHIVRGFSLNRTHLFDSVIRQPLQWTLERDTGSAVVRFPELVPGLHLVSPENFPYYKLVVSLGVMPDLFWDQSKYMPADPGYIYGGNAVYSSWYPLLEGSPATELKISLAGGLPKSNQYSLVLGVGICYGQLVGANHIKLSHGAGSAKVLDVR